MNETLNEVVTAFGSGNHRWFSLAVVAILVIVIIAMRTSWKKLNRRTCKHNRINADITAGGIDECVCVYCGTKFVKEDLRGDRMSILKDITAHPYSY